MSDISAGVKTRLQQSQRAFKHVINELFSQELDGPIASSLLLVTPAMDIRDILNLHDEEVNRLHYYTQELDTSSPPSKDDDAKPTTVNVKRDLPEGYKRTLKIFIRFAKHLREEGVEVHYDWSNIDSDRFEYFRNHNYYSFVTTPAPSRLVKPEEKSEDGRYNTTFKQSQVEQFKKYIKRDKSDFTVLKDKKQFKSWHQNLLATAAAQDVEEVLDPNYTPSNEEETNLFNEKQKYMYLVAMTILKIDR